MTLKEFSNKYGVPYSIVYEASYKVKVVHTMQRDIDYPETPLFQEVVKILGIRIQNSRERLERQEKIMDGLRCNHP